MANFSAVYRDATKGEAILCVQPKGGFSEGQTVTVNDGIYKGSYKIGHIYEFNSGGRLAGPGQNLYLTGSTFKGDVSGQVFAGSSSTVTSVSEASKIASNSGVSNVSTKQAVLQTIGSALGAGYSTATENGLIKPGTNPNTSAFLGGFTKEVAQGQQGSKIANYIAIGVAVIASIFLIFKIFKRKK